MTPPVRSVPSRSTPSGRYVLGALAVLVAVLLGGGLWWASSDASNPTAAPAGPAAAELPDDTRMGAVELVTDELAPMRAFYVDAMGLEVLAESKRMLSLGRDGEELLRIVRDDRSADVPTEAGLYHSAFLYPDASSLASTMVGVATLAPESYGGSADHAVSLAFYFAAPDGNGVELYVDTPRDGWVWEDGLVQMGSAALDPNAFIQANFDEQGTAAPPAMGHVHLRVGDLDEARAFYADALGFAVTAEADGALFYAAGGYHHHLATNTWGSTGAGQRPESLGLGSLSVYVGPSDALDGVADRLTENGVEFARDGDVLLVDDPWGNTVRLLAA